MSKSVRYLLVEVVADDLDMHAVTQRLKELVKVDDVQIRPVLSLGATSDGLSDITHFLGG